MIKIKKRNGLVGNRRFRKKKKQKKRKTEKETVGCD